MSEHFFQESTPVPGRRHPATDGATIGRGEADIVLVDPQVSRVHARLHVDGGGVAVEDLKSRNGTFVNEVRITSTTALREGDTVRMGDTVWRLFADVAVASRGSVRPEEAAAATPPESGVRGDVPAPDPLPSGVREVSFPEPAQAPAFSEPPRPPRRRGSAARIASATAYSYAVVVVTAIAVVLYLALR